MKKNRICFFTLYNDKGASSQYRVFQFKKDFEKKFIIKFCCFWNNKYITKYAMNKKKFFFHIAFNYIKNSIIRVMQLLIIAPKYDIVFFQKEIIPKCNIIFINYLKKRKVKVVFDIDDAIYVNQPKNNKYINIAKNVDLVIVGSNELMKYFKKVSSKIIKIPTIDYTPAYAPYRKNTYKEKIIGWIGTYSSVDNLELVVEAINKLTKEHPEVYFHMICDDDYGYSQKIDHLKLVKWKKNNYIKDLSNISIGIMPLKNNEFNRGKCGFKIIQYLNLYKPVLASNVGENKEIINGFGEIIGKDEWYLALKEYLFIDDKYLKIQMKIEEHFEEKYGYEVWKNRLICAIYGLID